MLSSDLLPAEGRVPKLLKPKELAEYLQITTATVRNYVKQGLLPKPKSFGPRRLYFNLEEVRSYLVRLETVGPDNGAQSVKLRRNRSRRVKR